MKKIIYLLFSVFIFSLFSCHSWFEDCTSENPVSVEYGVVSGSLKESASIKSMRSAFPEMPSPVTYTITAHRTDATVADINGTVDAVNLSYFVQLTTGTWDIDLKGYNCATLTDISLSNLIFVGSKSDVTISNDTPFYDNLDIIVNIRMEAGLTGTVALPVYAYTNIITSANAKWMDENGNQKTQTLTFVKDAVTNLYKSTFTMTDDTDGISAIEPGSYGISFEFYRTISGVSTLAYYCQDTVNIYSNMETNCWIDSANDSEYLTVVGTKKQLYLSENLLNKFLSNSFFVKDDGDDSHIGNYYQPFKTIQHAVDVIKEINDGGSQYSIYLLSDIEDSAETPSYTTTTNYSMVNINTTSGTYLKLLIGSFGATQYTINANRSSSKTGCVIYCNGQNDSTKYQTVTLRNLRITGGYITTAYYGGGVSVRGSTVNIVSCDISNNNSAGLYCYDNSSSYFIPIVNVYGVSKFNSNIDGIICKGGTLNITGTCEICDNSNIGFTSNSGYNINNYYIGGVALISGNKIGLQYDDGKVYLQDEVTIKSNSQYGFWNKCSMTYTYVYFKGKIYIRQNGNLSQEKNYVFSTSAQAISVNGALDNSDIGIYYDTNILATGTLYYCNFATNYLTNNATLPYASVFTSDQDYTLVKNSKALAIAFQKGNITTKTFNNIKLIPSTNVINKAFTGEGKFEVYAVEDDKSVNLDSIKLEVFRNGKTVDMNTTVTNSNKATLDFSYKTLGNYVIQVTGIYSVTNEDATVTKKTYTADFNLNLKNEIPSKGDIIPCGVAGSTSLLTKNSLVCVIEPGTTETIVGSDENWNSYYSGTTDAYKGAFIAGRTVKLSPYAIGQYEVTTEMYVTIMQNDTAAYKGSIPTRGNSGDVYALQPISALNWYDAVYFCNELTKRSMSDEQCVYTITNISRDTDKHITAATVTADLSKTGYRLPTETEWEFAARGGNTAATEWKFGFPGFNPSPKYTGLVYSDTKLADYAYYYYNNSSGYTREVGKYQPNSLINNGLYDMAGNVYELCFDGVGLYKPSGSTSSIINKVDNYDANFKDAGGVVINPIGGVNETSSVVKGGNLDSYASNCLVSYRTYTAKETTGYGLRLCRTLN